MRFFLDANVIFTAVHNPKGKAAFVIELGHQGYWKVHSSFYAMEEARRNLERKIPQAADGINTLQRDLDLAEHQAGLDYPDGLAKKDQPIFQAALACKATHLLTGDLEDFGPYLNKPEETFGIRILTVAEFLNLFEITL